MEVLDQFARLLLQITEFVANVKAIKRLGTNLQIIKRTPLLVFDGAPLRSVTASLEVTKASWLDRSVEQDDGE